MSAFVPGVDLLQRLLVSRRDTCGSTEDVLRAMARGGTGEVASKARGPRDTALTLIQLPRALLGSAAGLTPCHESLHQRPSDS